jgi:hypothetical protein
MAAPLLAAAPAFGRSPEKSCVSEDLRGRKTGIAPIGSRDDALVVVFAPKFPRGHDDRNERLGMRPTQPDERLPLARRTGLSITAVGGEILVYDRDSDTAHCLGETAALVWRACDGSQSLQALADRESLDRDTIRRALSELEELRLLDAPPVRVNQPARGLSRRQAVGRLAAAAVGPFVVSVAAPAAWAATSIRAKSTCGPGNVCPAGTVGCLSCGLEDCSNIAGNTGTCGGSSTTCTGNQGVPKCGNDCCPVNYICTSDSTCIRTF